MSPTKTASRPDSSAIIAALSTDEYRLDGRPKVTGAAEFTADIRLPGMLWAAFARSPIPHGQIVSVDTTAASRTAGVRSVLTGADTGPARIGRRLQDWPVLAGDRVRFIGDRVAAVAADTREAAQQAASLIAVDYEELPSIFDPDAALAADAPTLHPDAETYALMGGTRTQPRHPNIQGEVRLATGDPDLDRLFANADHVFDHEFATPRTHQGYLEPHACVVWLDGEVVHVIATHKAPFQLRAQMASSLGIAEARIDVTPGFIGGDFGGKGLALDEAACYFLARATGRPVMAVMDYGDDLRAANPRHAGQMRLRTAVTWEGRMIAHQLTAVFDGGAYAAGKPSPNLIPLGAFGTLNAYHVPAARLDVVSVYTNSVPGGNMRAPGEMQVTFASESHVDMIASALALDPLRFRLLNAVRDGEASANGRIARRPRVVEVLEALEGAAGSLRSGGGADRGIGYSVGVRSVKSIEPRVAGAAHKGGGRMPTSVALRLRPDAMIEAETCIPDQGGGTHTAIRRLAAAVLSVDERRIEIVMVPTSSGLTDGGVGGSKTTYMTGQAVMTAARELREGLVRLAAERLDRDEGTLDLLDDAFVIQEADGDAMGRRLRFGDVLLGAELGPIVGSFDSGADDSDSDSGSAAGYVVAVEVDRQTGQVTVTDVVLAVDGGTILNPLAHQGQLNGGFIQGLGAAVMEDLAASDGRVVASGLRDYPLPTSMDIPRLRTILLPPATGPGAFGGKFVGELSNSPVPAAIANAIAAAVGVRVTSLPLTAARILDGLGARVDGPDA